MEYPMISFNAGRPDKNGNISEAKLTYLVSVIIHEVGHNYFPMIVNSDERQATWMDEGLNTFLDKETMRVRYPELFSGTRGTPAGIVPFMLLPAKWDRASTFDSLKARLPSLSGPAM